jgi:7,8-dihydropterin-6-yl-methyl-4-(beta-D-ribofuranosyl)aminobenzene 5'-phosphate synthase
MPMVTEVDRLEVQVLVDNVTDSLSSTPPFVTREWPALVRKGMRRVAGGSLCCANHGLSLVIRATAAGREHVVLFDAGPVD